MQFPVTNDFVGSVRKETLQTTEEGVIVTATHLIDKLQNFKRSFHLRYFRIIWKQETHEPFLYFPIGEA